LRVYKHHQSQVILKPNQGLGACMM